MIDQTLNDFVIRIRAPRFERGTEVVMLPGTSAAHALNEVQKRAWEIAMQPWWHCNDTKAVFYVDLFDNAGLADGVAMESYTITCGSMTVDHVRSYE